VRFSTSALLLSQKWLTAAGSPCAGPLAELLRAGLLASGPPHLAKTAAAAVRLIAAAPMPSPAADEGGPLEMMGVAEASVVCLTAPRRPRGSFPCLHGVEAAYGQVAPSEGEPEPLGKADGVWETTLAAGSAEGEGSTPVDRGWRRRRMAATQAAKQRREEAEAAAAADAAWHKQHMAELRAALAQL
jgi:hypothetical protein